MLRNASFLMTLWDGTRLDLDDRARSDMCSWLFPSMDGGGVSEWNVAIASNGVVGAAHRVQPEF